MPPIMASGPRLESGLRPAAIRFDQHGAAQLTVAQGDNLVAVPLNREALWALAMQVFQALDEMDPAHGRPKGP